jgi:hypothetical protein
MAVEISSRFRHLIGKALEYHFEDAAIFHAERFHAFASTEESLLLLATAYFYKGKYSIVRDTLLQSTEPKCRFLLAQACFRLGKYKEVAVILKEIDVVSSASIKMESVYCLLGMSYRYF